MIKNIDKKIINKAININNNLQLVLIDGSDVIFKKKQLEISRNIFMVNSSGEVIWRIYSKNDKFGDSFTNIYEKNGEFKAYRWDGGQYNIDIKTGFATPEILLK